MHVLIQAGGEQHEVNVRSAAYVAELKAHVRRIMVNAVTRLDPRAMLHNAVHRIRSDIWKPYSIVL